MENRKRILVCDDDEGVRESLNLILSDKYDVSLCNNGDECCNCLSSEGNFDLALLDIKMPKMSGLEILKNIKSKKPDLKVIVITGYRSVDTATEAINAGACDYIVKPFDSKEVLKSVEKNIMNP